MLKRWFVYLAALLGSLVFFMANQGWLAWLLLMAVLWLPLASLLLSLPAMLTAQVQSCNNGTVPLSTLVMAQVKVTCPLPMPSYRCKVRIKRMTTGESRYLRIGSALPTDHCGQLKCTPARSWVYDYLCLFRFPIRKIQESTLTVRPAPVEIPLQKELATLLSRSWRPKPGGGYAENHELRLYRPGDSLNQVHWKLTAKTGKLTVREAMEPAASRILLTLALRGDEKQLDEKLGKLLWLGNHLLQMGMRFDLHALTASGVHNVRIDSEQTLLQTVDMLLGSPVAHKDADLPRHTWASWHYHIGGGTDEA